MEGIYNPSTEEEERLQLEVDVVRRALVSRQELLPVFGEMSFSDSTPEPGEMLGTDASNFAQSPQRRLGR